jgi:hypothetical protein
LDEELSILDNEGQTHFGTSRGVKMGLAPNKIYKQNVLCSNVHTDSKHAPMNSSPNIVCKTTNSRPKLPFNKRKTLMPEVLMKMRKNEYMNALHTCEVIFGLGLQAHTILEEPCEL